ncbi:hypothetical protein [Plantactinospora sonchi]|uniref:Vegetative cell wall protein gp1 n=1 Tax=Plantactinospora sonchi TaxID=1544735 RepID=A0ABU7RMG7_9ACTN
MIGLLTEISNRIASRWIVSVLLPGALLLLLGGCGIVLGHAQALDLDALVTAVERAVSRRRGQPVRWVVEVALAVGSAGLLGVTARGLGTLLQRFWLRERHLLPARLGLRQRRWSRYQRSLATARRHGIESVRAYLPHRPTWMGDRLRLVEARIQAQYRISATLVWPRVWLLTGDEVHAPVGNARGRFDAAAVLGGWSVLYLLLGAGWWPGAVIGGALMFVAVRRARVALDELALLVESAIDLHWRDLASALGVPVAGGTPSPEEAALIDDRLHKGG